MKGEICVPIYFYEDDDGKIVIAVEDIQDEFMERLKEVLDNPREFLEV